MIGTLITVLVELALTGAAMFHGRTWSEDRGRIDAEVIHAGCNDLCSTDADCLRACYAKAIRQTSRCMKACQDHLGTEAEPVCLRSCYGDSINWAAPARAIGGPP